MIRIKCRPFHKVLDEITVSIDLPPAVVIDRLREMQGICREKDGMGYKLEFICHKNGKFMITELLEAKEIKCCYLKGQVLAIGNKTNVKIHTLADASAKPLKWFSVAAALLLIVIFNLLMAFSGETSLGLYFFGSLAIAAPAAVVFFFKHKEERFVPADLEIMKNDILRKLEAVKRWDE